MPLTIESSIGSLLKEKTYAHHVRTEKLLIPRLKSIVSVEDYYSVLSIFYSFYKIIEPLVWKFISKEDLPDLYERRKLPLLEKDIVSINRNFEAIEVCKHTPQIDSKNKAFGVLYVMEGSTLGGPVIADIILKKTGSKIHEENLHFFKGYREATSAKWKVFQNSLNNQKSNPDEIINAAINTFSCMELHIANYL